MSVKIAELKDRVCAGNYNVEDFTHDELMECLAFCEKTWIAWRKSNAIAETKRKIVSVALKDPEVRAFMKSKGITL